MGACGSGFSELSEFSPNCNDPTPLEPDQITEGGSDDFEAPTSGYTAPLTELGAVIALPV